MSASNTIISLGDLMHAFGILKPEDDITRQAIVTILGMQERNPFHTRFLPVPPVPPPPLSPPQPPPDISPSTNRESPLPTAIPIPSVLEKGETSVMAKPPSVTPLSDEPAVGAKPSTLDPLFLPMWRRSILSTALATYSNDGVPDIDSLIESLVLMKPIEHIPEFPGPTLRRGVQVLVDRSTALAPFSADQDELLYAIIQIVGSDRTDVWDFTGSPLQGISDPNIPWAPYQLPCTGTVVALLTDLGIGQNFLSPERVEPMEWFTFCTMLHRAGCPVVAFVPYSSKRWPLDMAHTLKIIPWDRNTTVSMVHHIIGRLRNIRLW